MEIFLTESMHLFRLHLYQWLRPWFNSKKRRQWQSIIFESNNKQLIYPVKNKSFTCWGSLAIEQDIVSLLNSVSAFFSFIPWIANKAEDWIVQCTRKRICPLDWVSSVPLFLSSVLERDVLGFNSLMGMFLCPKRIKRKSIWRGT
ncbi:hypothetical protein J1N35_039007 [Gossypium stocksii]|uniref:Uncharacterized protein n=1 Tax=Gossypium stocksii TaxID=47602 RepID=A0A9D3UMY2_9ROSI|nr:hypothetical protein J1N35_039007 [Gossypium stocksii]